MDADIKAHFVEFRTAISGEISRVEKKFDASFTELDQRLGRFEEQVKAGFAAVAGRLSGLDHRLSGVEQKVSGLDQRLSGVEQQLSGLDQRTAGIDGKLDVLLARPRPSRARRR
ncbi:MAG TPA: hypothetical protein VMM93_13215 [Vicinamibacterales bacterium]|nr:hypothetical protein [Vicinamibacterales bacterium]